MLACTCVIYMHAWTNDHEAHTYAYANASDRCVHAQALHAHMSHAYYTHARIICMMQGIASRACMQTHASHTCVYSRTSYTCITCTYIRSPHLCIQTCYMHPYACIILCIHTWIIRMYAHASHAHTSITYIHACMHANGSHVYMHMQHKVSK